MISNKITANIQISKLQITSENKISDIRIYCGASNTSVYHKFVGANHEYTFSSMIQKDLMDARYFIIGMEFIIKTYENGFECSKILGAVFFSPYSHTFNDMKIVNYPLKVKLIRDKIHDVNVGSISGSIDVQTDCLDKPRKNTNIPRIIIDHHERYMDEFYKYVESHEPIEPKLEEYHTPVFISSQGPLLPGYLYYRWHHKNDKQEVYEIFKETIRMHPEYKTMDDFYHAINDHHNVSTRLNAIEVFTNMLNIRQYSTPYIEDTISVKKRKFHIDNYGQFSEQKCADCEDGCCYACKIWKILSDNTFNEIDERFEEVKNYFIHNYTFTILTMYCAEGECHVVPVLIKNVYIIMMMDTDPNLEIDITSNDPVFLILETTSPTSVYQYETTDERFESFRRTKYDKEKFVIEHFIKDDPNFDCKASSLDTIKGRYISNFYYYVTNVLIPLDDKYGYTSLLPIRNKDKKWGIKFYDLFNVLKYKWIGRVKIDEFRDSEILSYMNNTLPIYDIKIQWKAPEIKTDIRSNMMKSIDGNLNYIRINIFNQKGMDRILNEIDQFILQNMDKFIGFNIRKTQYECMIYLLIRL